MYIQYKHRAPSLKSWSADGCCSPCLTLGDAVVTAVTVAAGEGSTAAAAAALLQRSMGGATWKVWMTIFYTAVVWTRLTVLAVSQSVCFHLYFVLKCSTVFIQGIP